MRLASSARPSLFITAIIITAIGYLLLADFGTEIAGASPEKHAIRFDRDIRPILSENCFSCHGLGKQESGLRLDLAPAAFLTLKSGARAIVAGDVAASELLSRVADPDPDLVMPPPDSNKVLTTEQKSLLKEWIEAGAPYEKHWSFQPPARVALPAVSDPAAINPIDLFLESRLASEGLPVNPEADRPTLIRRISFALTGLPPIPAEVAAFLADPAADACEKLIDRLLLSPHYAEEMARHWLDAARYADTHGLHLDNERQMWAYRDWVVKSFEKNIPFDQFTIEQLAGDLIPNASQDQHVATGFSRCNVTTSEGGAINEEMLFRYAVDRTATMMQAFMGLTGQCAVCHDHKFDPLSQREFYSLYAFFNSAADPAMDGNAILTAPTAKALTAEQLHKQAEMTARIVGIEKEIEAIVDGIVYTDPATLNPRPESSSSETIWLDDEFPPAAAVKSEPGSVSWFASAAPGEVLSGQRSLQRTATGFGQDFYDSGAQPIVIPAIAEIFVHVWIDPASPPKSIMLQFRTDGWEHRAVWGDAAVIPWGETGTPSRAVIGPLPELGKWVRLSIPAATVGLNAGTQVTGFALSQFDGTLRWDLLGIRVGADPASDPTQSLAAWWKERTNQEKLDDVPNPLRDIVKAGPTKTTDLAEVGRVRRHWLTHVWSRHPEQFAAAMRELEGTRQAREEIDKTAGQTFVYKDLPTMRESFVMIRGAYDKPGEKVDRATPAFLPPLPSADGVPVTRLNLAQWLVSPDHPLTGRVAVNRLWQQFFGVGIVKTGDDFGAQGEIPSHPELLDWLAVQYRDSGWNTRQMVKMLLTSRAFKRASMVSPEQLARDPENRLLSRGPRLRLDAEQIRDNVLAVSGLLVRRAGGKGVRPYQPDNIWEPIGYAESNTRNYKRDSGENLYRRSLYTFLKRTAPPPFMVNFDAPSREQFCSRRERSNTPLQALQLMNDTQHIEAARALGARVLIEGGADDHSRMEWLYRTVLSRSPEPDELRVAVESLAGHVARYGADPEAATKVISHGESKPPQQIPPSELAAWTLVANMILNLDETLTRN